LRALVLGTVRAHVEADAPRVECPRHGVVVARVPWARHGARFTRDFEDQAAWCATQQSTSAVTRLLRVGWRAVGGIVARVAAEMRGRLADPLDGLRRIGIDEISYRRGQSYIIGVVCHDTGRLVWAAEGRSAAVLGRFFAELGPARCRQVRLVSADAGSWVHTAVRRHCPRALICMDPFHVVKLGSDALDEVRRDVWNAARRTGEVEVARFLTPLHREACARAAELLDVAPDE
jgi:transposase